MATVRKRKKIRDSLIEQLRLKHADTPYFLDKVEQYMNMWDTVDQMEQHIKQNGLTYASHSAAGKEYTKTNEFVKLIPTYVKQMQSILDSMQLRTDNVASTEDIDDDADDL